MDAAPAPIRGSAPRRQALRLAIVSAAALLGALALPPRAAGQAVPAAEPPTRAADAAQDTGFVEAVVRLDIEGGPSQVVAALAYGAKLLLPLRLLLEATEVGIAAFVLRDSAVAILEPGHVPLRFRPSARELTRGLAFSGGLLLALTGKGLSREDAYRLVQRHAMDTWDRGGQLRERVLSDPELAERLSKEEIDEVFRLDVALRHVDAIFERALGGGES